MTPIERAARAVGDTVSALPSAENNRAVARAVLQAIREPSEGMGEAASVYHIYGPDGDSAGHDLWQAMIDAALEER